MASRGFHGLFSRLAAFRDDRRGQVMILFALAGTAIFAGVGAGIDLGRAYMSRQKLSEVATLACQYASRPSVVQQSVSSDTDSGASASYGSRVTGYISTALQNQHFPWTQTNSTPFTWTQGGAANVSLTASVPTTFMKIARVTQLPIAASAHCYDSPANIPQRTPTGNSNTIVQEGFENTGCTGNCWYVYSPGQTPGAFRSTPTSSMPSSVTYTGTSGTQWYVIGYCVEIDSVGQIRSSVPEGTHSAELNCDNGSGTAGNSSISTRQYLAAGAYELRWNYASRVDYPNYDPVYICGNKGSDVSWATDNNSVGGPTANAVKNNQISVFLDLNSSGSPPTHATNDGTQQLAGANLIDVCVYSSSWIERSVRISVTTPGMYWLSFSADGQNNSFGGQIDNIRLCISSCSGSLQDNFPAAWLPSSGVNKVLFEDTFDSPSYANGQNYNLNGNAASSPGTSGTSASGWPSAAVSGWMAAPVNQIDYIFYGATQGSQFVQLDGYGGSGSTNRMISRPMLLMPGYYKVSYLYISDARFASLSGVYCGATPSAANLSALSGTAAATVPASGYSGTLAKDTNIVALFMSHAQLASNPNAAALNATVTYSNPDGTTSSSPTVPSNGISLTNYNSAQVNPLLDICGYAATWQTRTANILIQKPGYYWLTASALGTADNYGGAIDDVKLTALGSPYMSSPPSGVVTIPVPDPQPGATLSFTGFSITTDPLAP